jgi:betaine-aldehyde dehydrogenase
MHQYIGSRRRDASSGETFDVLDPSTNETLETVTLAGHNDVDAAVAAASEAFEQWSRATPAERSTVLLKAAQLLDERAEELAQLESRQTGKPIRLTTEFDVPGSLSTTSAFFAGRRPSPRGQGVRRSTPVTTRAPSSGASRSASSDRSPRGTTPADGRLEDPARDRRRQHHRPQARRDHPADQRCMLAEAPPRPASPPASSTSSPARGRSRARHLVGHPDVRHGVVHRVDARRATVMETAAAHGKRVHLELGGKAPFVVFDDADLEAAVHGAVAGIPDQHRAGLHRGDPGLSSSGRCTTSSSPGCADLMAAVRMGDPDGPETPTWDPLISRRPAGEGRRHGRACPRLRHGSSPAAAPGGRLGPGLLLRADPDHRRCRRTARSGATRCSGRCWWCVPFDDDDEAIRLANDTPFGLAASAWTRDTYRAAAGHPRDQGRLRVDQRPHPDHQRDAARRVQAVGFGKDMSAYSFEEYTNVKHVMHDVTAVAHKPWHRTIFTLPG